MTSLVGDGYVFSANGIMSAAVGDFVGTHPASDELSGVGSVQDLTIATNTQNDIVLPDPNTLFDVIVQSTRGFDAVGSFILSGRRFSYTDIKPNRFINCTQIGTSAVVIKNIARNSMVTSTRTDNYEPVDDTWLYQTFRFPADYVRGTKDEEQRVPDLTGLEVDVAIEPDLAVVATLDWRFDYYDPKRGWVGLCQGTEIGAATDGDHVWFDIRFKPQKLDAIWQYKFRFGIQGRPFVGGDPLPFDAAYNGKTVTIDATTYQVVPDISPVPLQPGSTYPFVDKSGSSWLLAVDAGSPSVSYGKQQGVTKIWYTSPNPLGADPNSLKAYALDGVNPVMDGVEEVAFRFRILTSAPDSDHDYFNNKYRTATYINSPNNTQTSTGNLSKAFWLSKPNPSAFAVESLYFTMGREPIPIDSLLIDPTTPGVYFHVYWSNDPGQGYDMRSWDALLWTRVPQTYHLKRRETIAFPKPIQARFIKIEFTHLQPRYYSPGRIREPMVYSKHPKWVLDYYLALFQQQRAEQLEAASTVTVNYDALDLAYNYYLDDIKKQYPDAPLSVESAEGVSVLTDYLKSASIDDTNTVDTQTLGLIRTSMQPFLGSPFSQGKFQDILRTYALPETDSSNYPSEVLTNPIATTDQVSSLDRESVIVEKQFPVTSFYVTCRHNYRISQAQFEHDRAYFVGIKEIAFLRNHYATRHDAPIYIETGGDPLNIEGNDLAPTNDGLALATYNDTS